VRDEGTQVVFSDSPPKHAHDRENQFGLSEQNKRTLETMVWADEGSRRPEAVVSFSGGLDSTVLLAHAMLEHSGYVEAVTFRYGQKHEIEISQARKICSDRSIPLTEITLPAVFSGPEGAGRSALTHANVEMPHMTYEEIANAQGPSPTYVPFRNANFISQCVAHALTIGAKFVYVAVHAEDAHNWAYPDCTPEFIGAMQNAVWVGTYHEVRLVAPFQYMSKSQIIHHGTTIGDIPWEDTHSCYEGTRPACGICPTCVARLHAFQDAGMDDPLAYRGRL
jgi:7-cyano-7-deazaguanine synthase